MVPVELQEAPPVSVLWLLPAAGQIAQGASAGPDVAGRVKEGMGAVAL